MCCAVPCMLFVQWATICGAWRRPSRGHQGRGMLLRGVTAPAGGSTRGSCAGARSDYHCTSSMQGNAPHICRAPAHLTCAWAPALAPSPRPCTRASSSSPQALLRHARSALDPGLASAATTHLRAPPTALTARRATVPRHTYPDWFSERSRPRGCSSGVRAACAPLASLHVGK